LEIDETFERDYEVEIGELPPSGGDICYVGGNGTHRTDGLILQLRKDCANYLAQFAFGDWGGNYISWVGGTPNREILCVVARGQTYLLHALTRTAQAIGKTRVSRVIADPAAKLLVVADYTTIFGIGSKGIAWTSNELSDDELSLTRVEGGHAFLTVWKAEFQQSEEVIISLIDGRVVG